MSYKEEFVEQRRDTEKTQESNMFGTLLNRVSWILLPFMKLGDVVIDALIALYETIESKMRGPKK